MEQNQINTKAGINTLPQLKRPMMRARIARALRVFYTIPGWQGLINRLVPDHSAPFSIRNSKTVFSGDLGSYIDRQVYLFGGYESLEIRCFLSTIKKEGHCTVLDIGANCGTHSLAFSASFETVHAFEPNPMLWHQFERNMAANGLINVQLHKIGLADSDSDLTLYLIDKPNYGLGTFSVVEQYDSPLLSAATCPVRHAGNYLAEIGTDRVDAVKIDVQGFEPEVLRGLSSVLRRDRPVIWCEIAEGTLTKLSTIRDLSKLVPFKFNAYQMVSRRSVLANSVELQEHKGELPCGNYLLVPK